ncbi:MAG TPA: error-prone DNA polymerase, partial [Brevundimonas sp.]|nr:error-prone DNA polymerase [Brevundimonas sp.]
MQYAELQCASHFSFLRGASGCDELFAQAAVCGLSALAITDLNSVAGIVRAHEAAKVTGVRLIIGCRVQLTDETAILAYPTDRAAYSRLCRLLTLGKGRAGKGACHLDWSDLADHAKGLIAVLVTDRADAQCRRRLTALSEVFGMDAYCALTLRRRPRDQMRLHQLSELATELGVKTVVTNDVLFHHPDRRILQDVVTCIREGSTIDDVGFRRERSADRHLKRAEEMHRLFARYPDALRNTIEIADRCRFNLDELSYQYPKEAALPGQTPQQALDQLTWEGAADRYPDGVPEKVRASL